MGSHKITNFITILLLTTAVPETQSNGESNVSNTPSGGLKPGAIVGIIFGLLIVLVLGVAIVVIVLLIVRHIKTGSGGKYSTTNGGTSLGKHTQ